MARELDLDKIRVEGSLLQAMEMCFAHFEMAVLPNPTDPMIFDLGVSTLSLPSKLFDRLVQRCVVVYKNDPHADVLNSADMELSKLGLVDIKAKLGLKEIYSPYYDWRGDWHDIASMGTFAAEHEVSISCTGRVVLKLAGFIAIIESLIRQGLFSILEVLMPLLSTKWLPELLAHTDLRIRKLAADSLAQLEEEE